MNFEGRSQKNREDYYNAKWKSKQQDFMNSKGDFKTEFQKLCRDPELYNEIKVHLKHAKELINQSKQSYTSNARKKMLEK